MDLCLTRSQSRLRENLIHLPDEPDRGLVELSGVSNQRIVLTCHARWQGPSRTVPCALEPCQPGNIRGHLSERPVVRYSGAAVSSPPFPEGGGDPAELEKSIRRDDWNNYVVIAKGYVFTHIINGQAMTPAIDEDEVNFRKLGILVLQLHSGKPMRIEVKAHLNEWALRRRQRIRQPDVKSRVLQVDLQFLSQATVAATLIQVRGVRLFRRCCGNRLP